MNMENTNLYSSKLFDIKLDKVGNAELRTTPSEGDLIRSIEDTLYHGKSNPQKRWLGFRSQKIRKFLKYDVR